MIQNILIWQLAHNIWFNSWNKDVFFFLEMLLFSTLRKGAIKTWDFLE